MRVEDGNHVDGDGDGAVEVVTRTINASRPPYGATQRVL